MFDIPYTGGNDGRYPDIAGYRLNQRVDSCHAVRDIHSHVKVCPCHGSPSLCGTLFAWKEKMDLPSLESKSEQRESPRFPFTATVMFEKYLTGNYHDGRMVNYSREGMCFEADVAPGIDTEIFIGIEKSPYSSQHDVFRAKVVWLRELPLKESYYAYAIGVKYC